MPSNYRVTYLCAFQCPPLDSVQNKKVKTIKYFTIFCYNCDVVKCSCKIKRKKKKKSRERERERKREREREREREQVMIINYLQFVTIYHVGDVIKKAVD